MVCGLFEVIAVMYSLINVENARYKSASFGQRNSTCRDLY